MRNRNAFLEARAKEARLRTCFVPPASGLVFALDLRSTNNALHHSVRLASTFPPLQSSVYAIAHHLPFQARGLVLFFGKLSSAPYPYSRQHIHDERHSRKTLHSQVLEALHASSRNSEPNGERHGGRLRQGELNSSPPATS